MNVLKAFKVLGATVLVASLLGIAFEESANAFSQTAYLKRCNMKMTSRGTIYVGIYRVGNQEMTYWFEYDCPLSIEVETFR